MSRSLIDILQNLGHEVVMQASYGNMGFVDEYNGVKIYPVEHPQKYGVDRLLFTAHKVKPDLYLSTFDIFVLKEEVITEMQEMDIKVASWLMIDASPYQSLNYKVLKHIDYPIVCVNWALDQIPKVEELKKPYFVMHLPTEKIYHHKDKIEAREAFNLMQGEEMIDENTELTTVVSANIGDETGRKNFPSIIRGWLGYIRINGSKNKKLYLHTEVKGTNSRGVNIREDLAFAGYNKEEVETIIFPNQLKYLQSEHTANDLCNIYNASDLYLNPSDSEGYGLPIAEAMLCGCPILVTDWGASKELATNGLPQKMLKDSLLHSGSKYIGFHAYRGSVSPIEVTNGLIRQHKASYSNEDRELISFSANQHYGYQQSISRMSDFLKTIQFKKEW